MKANPGGQIDTATLIGRNSLIINLWETLEQQSVVLTAERRIGKTTVLKKMLDEPAPRWRPVYQDLERAHTAAEFAMEVYKTVHEFLSRGKRTARRAMEFLKGLGGIEIGGLVKLPDSAQPPWKEVLTHSIEDLVHECDHQSDRLLFLWDEVPFMIGNIRYREGATRATEVLDVLRALRQTHPALRMVVTGSIGLHHVLTSLKEKNYANAPLNDMVQVDVPPLAEADAKELAAQLIKGEAISSPDSARAAETIAREADCFPFFVQHIVKALKLRNLTASPEEIAGVVASQLVDPNDPWELQHFLDRIPQYYPKDAAAVRLILDELAVRDTPATADELLAMLKNAGSLDDREPLLRLLELMGRDHYLARNAEGAWHFRFALIRRWWKLKRCL
jgi:hypothetical protein